MEQFVFRRFIIAGLVGLALVLTTGCESLQRGWDFMGEVFEGNFDSEAEYLAALDTVLAEFDLSDAERADLRDELAPLWSKYRALGEDWGELRQSVRSRILSRLASNLAGSG